MTGAEQRAAWNAWLDAAILDELSFTTATPGELADAIGGIPVDVSPRGPWRGYVGGIPVDVSPRGPWRGYLRLTPQKVANRLRVLNGRGVVRPVGRRWEAVR